jgi:hypothetical protein
VQSQITVERRCRSRWLGGAMVSLLCLYGLLLIPEPATPQPQVADGEAWVWDRDAFWRQLEGKFRETRALNQDERTLRFNGALEQVQHALAPLGETNLPPTAAEFDILETKLFEFAPIAAACPERLPDFMNVAGRIRQLVKRQSERWPTDVPKARQRLYRLLYGSRAAVEEALLQSPQPTNALEVVSSYGDLKTPVAEVRGLKVQSGDILVSRGGAATSALIARGNDFPGNFSHIALVHVDETTGRVSVIESHIESGVGVRPIEQYLADTKLRILVLRLRSDLPAVAADPTMPHKASSRALRAATTRGQHIPYDFAMDCADHTEMFCSEVAAAAYQPFGVKLWMGMSHISTPGVTAWLGALGVRNFETQEPCDLEYDPQVRVVGEWRDPETLFKDHVDNAVVDVMLEGAGRGDKLSYNPWLLPGARLAKAWSIVKNWFGQVGPIPEGMSAATALRVKRLNATHASVKARVLEKAAKFKAERGYVPPYWELVRMARESQSP